MVPVIVDGVGVHVADGEGVDEQTQERGDEQQHHGDVVDMNAETKGDLGGYHAGAPHAGRKPRPVRELLNATVSADEVRDEPNGQTEAGRHESKGDEPAFLEGLFPDLVTVEHLTEEQDHREGQHGQKEDVRRVLRCCAVYDF